jgi:hypothetical protein
MAQLPVMYVVRYRDPENELHTVRHGDIDNMLIELRDLMELQAVFTVTCEIEHEKVE